MGDVEVDQKFRLAADHHLAGRLAEAERAYREVLAAEPNHAGALQYLGALCLRSGRVDEAIQLIQRSIHLKPDDADAHGNLGNALRAKGDFAGAAASYERAIQLKPSEAQIYFNLGNVRVDQGRLDLATESYRRAIELKKDFAGAFYNLGKALADQRQWEEAVAAFQGAIRAQPRFPEAYFNLGHSLLEVRQFEEAAKTLRMAIQLMPHSAVARNMLGSALSHMGDNEGAEREFREAIRLKPDYDVTYSNLARTQAENGEMDDALVNFRRAIELAPHNPVIHSNLVYALYFRAGSTAAEILSEHRQWAHRHAQGFVSQIRPFENDREPSRRLRIGYVSPDFWNHPGGRFMMPLLAAHDHGQFEIFCYSSVVNPDAFTARAQGYADVWRDIRTLPDERAADVIRGDGIDILLDLSLHMAGNRMLLFARRPAPVQVTYLAYPGTSGLDAMDYRITDPFIDRPGSDDGRYSEKSIRLPHCYWCYEAPEGSPDVAPLPAAGRGNVTFGCLNNFSKVSPAALETWAAILSALPGSRLLLHAQAGSHRDRAGKFFAQRGVSPDRLSFVQRAPFLEYLKTYERIDIALDPFPYVGGTTSCDALWMGAPVVTLAGELATGRGGVSIMNNIAHSEWIADSPGQFIEIAKTLAGDLAGLARIRSGLRDRMRNSPLMDAKRFAADMENAYRQMWRAWSRA
jgi:protein O-GlcNAc transferase